MEILAYSHLTLAQEPETLGSYSAASGDRLRTLTAVAGAVFMGAAALAPAPASAQSAVLSRNDTGTEVTRVQNRLAELGYFSANATGFFGSITEDAVTQFQRDKGLQADGVVGSQTLAALFGTSTAPQKAPQSTPAPAASSNTTTSSGAISSATANPATAQLQRDLAALGYDTGTIDGIYGSKTAKAVEAFQRASGLTVNGVPSINTLEALETALAGAPTNTNSVTAQATPRVVDQANSGTTSSSATQVKAETNQDSLVVQRGNQTGRIIVQNSPDRTVTETLTTVPVTPRIASIPPLNAGVQQVALAPASNTSLAIGGDSSSNRYTLPYVVAVPNRGSAIEDVQEFLPGAYVAASQRGSYVYAGSFANRQQAEALSAKLRSEGLDARVAFRP
ncbi:MAG: peptidoglycan-binding protein [Prochlorotrichaceae cyanobacterium]|jgi:peptidoglycan hydrolase-like protein with peptidoglycan-binding domain